jgi:hypothetical protein
MKAVIQATAPSWRAPPSATSPWGRRPLGLWTLVVESWRESIDVYARTGLHMPGLLLPWGPFW